MGNVIHMSVQQAGVRTYLIHFPRGMFNRKKGQMVSKGRIITGVESVSVGPSSMAITIGAKAKWPTVRRALILVMQGMLGVEVVLSREE